MTRPGKSGAAPGPAGPGDPAPGPAGHPVGTAAPAVAILDTVHRSRTTAVIPAAVRVTSAQRRTRRRLFWARRSGYLTLNRRALPGRGRVIGHPSVAPGRV